MTSSEIARAALAAQIGVAALVVTSAHMRVMARPAPRRRAYLVAWAVCTAVIAGLVWLTDSQVGNVDVERRVRSGLVAATTVAVALAAGAWWTRSDAYRATHRLRFVTLLLVHVAVILAIASLFI